MKIEDIIKRLPKAEIHIHAEAIVTYESYYALNKKNRVNPDLSRPEDFEKLFTINSLGDMISNFIFLQTMYRKPDDYQYMVDDVERYCAVNNISYIEMHVSPSMVIQQGFISFDDFLDALSQGFDRLEESGGPIVNLIVDLSRTFGPENARKNLNLLLDHKKHYPAKRIVAAGLGGQEEGNSCLGYKDILLEAKESGLNLSIHAGEVEKSHSIWDAIKECGADRIGHGISAIWDEKLMEYLTEKQIPVEVCPTSNLVTKKYVQTYETHPMFTFLERGMKVTLNTDDPVLFDIQLNREFELCLEAGKLKTDSAVMLIQNSIDAAFTSDEVKTKLTKELEAAAKSLLQ
jgi:adenosine deaminase